MTMQTLNLINVKKEILIKCIQDPSFKEKCLKNPKKAIEEVLKIELPEKIQVKALEDSDKTLHVVLPSQTEAQHLPVMDKELDEFSPVSESKKALNLFIFKQFLILKSLKNTEFKRHLLANPNEAIEKISKMPLPKDVQFKIFEDTEDLIHVALPSQQVLEDLSQMSELSDEELKKVAGGTLNEWLVERLKPLAKWLGATPPPSDSDAHL